MSIDYNLPSKLISYAVFIYPRRHCRVIVRLTRYSQKEVTQKPTPYKNPAICRVFVWWAM